MAVYQASLCSTCGLKSSVSSSCFPGEWKAMWGRLGISQPFRVHMLSAIQKSVGDRETQPRERLHPCLCCLLGANGTEGSRKWEWIPSCLPLGWQQRVVVGHCVFQRFLFSGDRLSQRLRRVLLLFQSLYQRGLWKTPQCKGQSSTHIPTHTQCHPVSPNVKVTVIGSDWIAFCLMEYGPSTPLSWPIWNLLVLWDTILKAIRWGRGKHLLSWVMETAWAVIFSLSISMTKPDPAPRHPQWLLHLLCSNLDQEWAESLTVLSPVCLSFSTVWRRTQHPRDGWTDASLAHFCK